ncbi:MAG: capsule assembly Wzi family protein [Treponema sp.]|nr:capsule assembly Wzi family protein [Treponema sp.]
MKHLNIFSIFLLLSITSPILFAETAEVIPLSSPVYQDMDSLYRLYGIGTPSAVRPWTKAEALLILERINPQTLEPDILSLYTALYETVHSPLRFGFGDGVQLDARLALNLEMYSHSNTEDFVNEDDWVKRLINRAPLAQIDLSAVLGSWFYVTSDIQYSWNFNTEEKDRFTYPDNIGALIPPGKPEYKMRIYADAYASGFTLNIPPHSYDMECEFPKRAFVAVGTKHMTLSVGRDRLQWGNGQSGNFLIDSNRDFDNYLRFSLFYDKFRYDLLTTIYDKYDYDGSGIEKSRYFMLHRLEFRILPKLVFSISENIIYQDQFFNIRYLNPAFIYHNWDEKALFNAIAHIEADFAFAPRWNAYVQWVLDQARAPNENDSEAGSWGILGGVEYTRPLNVGKPAFFTMAVEGVYTSPELYRRDRVDFMVLNRRISFNTGDSYSFEYIGYPYGGDALVAQFDAHLSVPNNWEIGFRLFGMLHGAMNPFMSHNEAGNNAERANIMSYTPSGSGDTVERTFIASLFGTYAVPQFFPWVSFTVFAELDIISKTNKRMYQDSAPYIQYKPGTSADVQFSLGMRATL